MTRTGYSNSIAGSTDRTTIWLLLNVLTCKFFFCFSRNNNLFLSVFFFQWMLKSRHGCLPLLLEWRTHFLWEESGAQILLRPHTPAKWYVHIWLWSHSFINFFFGISWRSRSTCKRPTVRLLRKAIYEQWFPVFSPSFLPLIKSVQMSRQQQDTHSPLKDERV